MKTIIDIVKSVKGLILLLVFMFLLCITATAFAQSQPCPIKDRQLQHMKVVKDFYNEKTSTYEKTYKGEYGVVTITLTNVTKAAFELHKNQNTIPTLISSVVKVKWNNYGNRFFTISDVFTATGQR
jgi:hypothetical protein